MKRFCFPFFLIILFTFSLNGCTDKIADAPIIAEMEHHFAGFKKTVLSHKLNVTRLTIDRDNFAPSGWEIGIFTRRGELAGTGVWDADSGATIHVYASDDEVNQFNVSDSFDARLWSPADNEEIPADITGYTGIGTWTAAGFTQITIDGYHEHELNVELRAGGNMMSINIRADRSMFVQPEGPEVPLLLAQLVSGGEANLLMVKNEKGSPYVPSRNFNGIPYWNIAEGYEILVRESTVCSWVGRPVPANQAIKIASGWNKIGYYPTYPLSCDSNSFTAISSIRDAVIRIEDEEGRFALPQHNFSNMIPWHEGEGYSINVRWEVQLRYPPQEHSIRPIQQEDTARVFGPWTKPRTTGAGMQILVLETSGIPSVPGDAIAAFNTDNVLVGLGHVGGGKAGIAVRGDDLETEIFEGLRRGDTFTLSYWSEAAQEIIPLGVSVVSGGGLTYSDGDLTVVRGIAQ